jgi:AraC-like DNA-binding protein
VLLWSIRAARRHAIITHMGTPPLPETCCDEPPTVWLWSGHAAYRGPSLQLDRHSGSVDCFALGLDASFTVHVGAADRQARSALIPARTPHQVLAGDGRMMFFYVDPSAAGSRNVASQMTDRTATVSYDHRDEPALISAWRQAPLPDPEVLRKTVLGDGATAPIDARVRAAMDHLRSRPADPVSAADTAAAVGLSTSRFLHVFSAQAGTSFRRYRLWARMCQVAAALSAGADLTTASTEAGFASPSHFSDAFRAMFGLSASALLSGQTRIVVRSP